MAFFLHRNGGHVKAAQSETKYSFHRLNAQIAEERAIPYGCFSFFSKKERYKANKVSKG